MQQRTEIIIYSMYNTIHTISTKSGYFRYREFDIGLNAYITPPLTEKEMQFYLLTREAYSGISSLSLNALLIADALKRAREQGDSVHGKRRLDRWENAPQVYWGDRFPQERTKRAFMADTLSRIRKPLHEIIAETLKASIGGPPDHVEKYEALIKLLAYSK